MCGKVRVYDLLLFTRVHILGTCRPIVSNEPYSGVSAVDRGDALDPTLV